jgi:hypothetical protein
MVSFDSMDIKKLSKDLTPPGFRRLFFAAPVGGWP